MFCARLERMGPVALAGGLRVATARRFRDRLVGLAGLDELPAGWALRIPGCRSVHTLGMRFPVDLIFLDAHGRVVRVAPGIPPRRLRTCRRAQAVLELRSGEAERFLLAQPRGVPELAELAGVAAEQQADGPVRDQP
jgi:uncharacterized membrane protein (UPF0127 family)